MAKLQYRATDVAFVRRKLAGLYQDLVQIVSELWPNGFPNRKYSDLWRMIGQKDLKLQQFGNDFNLNQLYSVWWESVGAKLQPLYKESNKGSGMVTEVILATLLAIVIGLGYAVYSGMINPVALFNQSKAIVQQGTGFQLPSPMTTQATPTVNLPTVVLSSKVPDANQASGIKEKYWQDRTAEVVDKLGVKPGCENLRQQLIAKYFPIMQGYYDAQVLSGNVKNDTDASKMGLFAITMVMSEMQKNETCLGQNLITTAQVPGSVQNPDIQGNGNQTPVVIFNQGRATATIVQGGGITPILTPAPTKTSFPVYPTAYPTMVPTKVAAASGAASSAKSNLPTAVPTLAPVAQLASIQSVDWYVMQADARVNGIQNIVDLTVHDSDNFELMNKLFVWDQIRSFWVPKTLPALIKGVMPLTCGGPTISGKPPRCSYPAGYDPTVTPTVTPTAIAWADMPNAAIDAWVANWNAPTPDMSKILIDPLLALQNGWTPTPVVSTGPPASVPSDRSVICVDIVAGGVKGIPWGGNVFRGTDGNSPVGYLASGQCLTLVPDSYIVIASLSANYRINQYSITVQALPGKAVWAAFNAYIPTSMPVPTLTPRPQNFSDWCLSTWRPKDQSASVYFKPGDKYIDIPNLDVVWTPNSPEPSGAWVKNPNAWSNPAQKNITMWWPTAGLQNCQNFYGDPR